MSRDELEAIAQNQRPLTGRLCVSLAQTLLAVLDDCDRQGPAPDDLDRSATTGGSFVLGYKTKARVIAALVNERELA